MLIHNGVAFPPEYDYKGLSIKIKGIDVKLTPLQEEMAYAWAKKKDTPYVKDPVFVSNFLKDFLATFDGNLKDITKDISIEDIDFSNIYKVVEEEKRAKESLTKEEKKVLSSTRKRLKEELKKKYGWAIVDNNKFEVANWMVEPPGLFLGRGAHPLRGRWKPRIYANDVILNLSEDAPIPEGDWKEIVHDHESMWLAKWIDKLTKKEKYVWLADTARPRQERDKEKYDEAKRLSKKIGRIVKEIYKGMRAKDKKKRMVATVCYLIYKLAMRVGDEKDPDEADTVGATTLRIEHVKLKENLIEFDFLGKDSVRWQKSIEINEENKILYDNLKEFMKGKKEGDLIFSDITSRSVNNFLGKIMRGLTAKVFRTYLATNAVIKYLTSINYEELTNENSKIYHAKMANLQAAITCNHKRAPPKNFEKSVEKKKERLEKILNTKPKTKKQEERLKERAERLKLQIELALNIRDYNLNTSLKNYIDPRVFKAWCDHVKLDWSKLYTASLRRKFQWAKRCKIKWDKMIRLYN